MPTGRTILIVSDGIGETAHQVAKAALGQFEANAFRVVRLPKMMTKQQLAEAVEDGCAEGCIFLYTLANPDMRAEMERLVVGCGASAVDILGPVIDTLATSAGTTPLGVAGTMRKIDRSYFERVGAMEFAVNHDDGRGAETLDEADIVLVGVSRTSKTPLSMYLASRGYKVANIPLVQGDDPPEELFRVESRRVFGLIIESDTLTEIRAKRMGELGGYTRRYAEPDAVERELEWARGVMRRIGCVVIKTTGRAIEEVALEVLRYYNA
ncbi:MAG: pyruvate, water dikinase regulatory protein [Coriobacteriia bacterium]|nr:pyruvate, water dikinase regulatory protein [Coriobacteriia bacterium]